MADVTGPDMKDTLTAGVEAERRKDWRRGYELLKPALAANPDDPRILAPLAECAWWLQLHDEAIEYRERAYRAFYQAGDWLSAARMALKLDTDYRITKAQPAVASGWLQRAADLVEGQPLSSAHLDVKLRRARMARNIDLALAQTDEVITLARRHGEHDIEMVATLWKGELLVSKGEVDEGLRLQDTALAAAVGGELGPWTTVAVYCHFIHLCEDRGDVERASEWTSSTLRYCERNGISGFPGYCRLHRVRLLRMRGAWRDAEAEAYRAAEEIRPTNPNSYGQALAEVAEIRRRLGDVEGAWELAEKAGAAGVGAAGEPIVSLIVADREGPEPAFYRLERTLRLPSLDRIPRARLVAPFVEMAIACGRVDAAEEYVAELEEMAAGLRTTVLRAQALGARGRLLLAKGQLAAARAALEGAVQAWAAADAPFEGARDRRSLAETLLANGDRVGAQTEAGEALRVLEELGAVPEAARARAVLQRAASTGRATENVATLMFTDLVGSTALVEAIGDEAWHDLAAWLDVTLRAIFTEHCGREIDHAGDGFFVLFATPADAIACACVIQRRLTAHRREHGYSPQVRIGIHAGRVITSAGAVRGSAVNRTARICGLAAGGQIIASREALEASGRPVDNLRRVQLRGVRGEVEVGEVEWCD